MTLCELQGALKRIKNYPYARNYYSIAVFLVMIFVAIGAVRLLSAMRRSLENPAGIERWTVWLNVPFSAIVGWVFVSLEKVGENSSNPFEGGRQRRADLVHRAAHRDRDADDARRADRPQTPRGEGQYPVLARHAALTALRRASAAVATAGATPSRITARRKRRDAVEQIEAEAARALHGQEIGSRLRLSRSTATRAAGHVGAAHAVVARQQLGRAGIARRRAAPRRPARRWSRHRAGRD